MKQLHELADVNPGAIDYAFTQAANSGDLSEEGFVQTITEKLGGDREQVESLIEAARATYVAATDAAVAGVSNVEPSLVYDWLRDQKPEMAARVIMDAQMGRFGSIKEATGAYLSDLSTIDPEAALNADLGPHAKAECIGGKVAVRINGKLYSWREAMRHRIKS